jgi:hypothetical protein
MRAALLALFAASAACGSQKRATSGDAGTTDAGTDGAADQSAPPPWLKDAGLVTRTAVEKPLRELCGIASNPGDLPLANDPLSRGMRAGYFAAANDLGLARIRRDFTWSQIEPMEGTFEFAPFDALVSQASAAGVKLLATPYGTPKWAASDPDSSANSGPRNTTDYASFAGALATHFAGKLSGYEIWNEESDGIRFWAPTLGGDPAVYGQLLVNADQAMRNADPDTPVLFGGCTFDPQVIPPAIAFQSSVFQAVPAAASAFEGMALHPYEAYPPSTPPEHGSSLETPLRDKVEEEAWLLARHHDGSQPIWLTEIGWPVTVGDPLAALVTEDDQARYLVRATMEAAAAGAAAIYWYCLRDGSNPTAFPPEGAFGLLHNDEKVVGSIADGGDALDGGGDGGTYLEATPKKSYLALKELLAVVGARWPSTATPKVTGLPADGYALAFAGSDPGKVIALWTVTSTAMVELSGESGNVVDILGNAKGSSAGGVPVGPDPVYVVVP